MILDPVYIYLILTWIVLTIWAVCIIIWHHKYSQRQLERREIESLIKIAVGFVGGIILLNYLLKKGIVKGDKKLIKDKKQKIKNKLGGKVRWKRKDVMGVKNKLVR